MNVVRNPEDMAMRVTPANVAEVTCCTTSRQTFSFGILRICARGDKARGRAKLRVNEAGLAYELNEASL